MADKCDVWLEYDEFEVASELWGRIQFYRECWVTVVIKTLGVVTVSHLPCSLHRDLAGRKTKFLFSRSLKSNGGIPWWRSA